MDQIGRAISGAVLQAGAQDGCEVRLTFATEVSRAEASKRLMRAATLEVFPGAGNFIFDIKGSKEHQIEMLNGSCILLLLESTGCGDDA